MRYKLIVKGTTPDVYVALADVPLTHKIYAIAEVSGMEQYVTVDFPSDATTHLNEWFCRDSYGDCKPGIGYPAGSLLYWTAVPS